MVERLDCVVAGDHGVGKTYLLHMHFSNTSFDGVTPSVNPAVFEQNLVMNNKPAYMVFNEFAGQCDYHYLRADVFIVCFSADDKSSFEHVKTKWIPELKHHFPSTPFYLVCTKVDLRESGEISISEDEGRHLAFEIGAVDYLECSAKRRQGIETVFHSIVDLFLQSNSNRKEDVDTVTDSTGKCAAM